MKRFNRILLGITLLAAMLTFAVGCDVIEEYTDGAGTPASEPAPAATTPAGETPPPAATEETTEKTVLVWCRDGVRNATMNGGNQLLVGQDNSVLILTGHPLWVEFDYTDSYGREQHTRIDLDDYYDYFILSGNGGWTQLKHQNAYENEKGG